MPPSSPRNRPRPTDPVLLCWVLFAFATVAIYVRCPFYRKLRRFKADPTCRDVASGFLKLLGGREAYAPGRPADRCSIRAVSGSPAARCSGKAHSRSPGRIRRIFCCSSGPSDTFPISPRSRSSCWSRLRCSRSRLSFSTASLRATRISNSRCLALIPFGHHRLRHAKRLFHRGPHAAGADVHERPAGSRRSCARGADGEAAARLPVSPGGAAGSQLGAVALGDVVHAGPGGSVGDFVWADALARFLREHHPQTAISDDPLDRHVSAHDALDFRQPACARIRLSPRDRAALRSGDCGRSCDVLAAAPTARSTRIERSCCSPELC